MNPARKGKVLCAGRTYCDLVFSGVPNIPKPGEEVYASHLEIHPGGGAFITASYLAGLGVEAALCSVLPTGQLGQEVMHHLNRSPVELMSCEAAADHTEPQVTVAISLSDDRSFLTNRSGPALPPSVDQALADPQVVHLHIGELATLSECPDLARNAKACGLTVSLDCSWDEALFGERSTRQLFGDIDLFLPNEKELRALLELRHSLQDAARQITALCPLVVVKQGAAGATAFFDDTTVSASAAHAELVDTTGAGDAFNAGFIAAWLAGENPRDCLISGNRMGGLAVQSMGGANNGDAAALLTHAV